MNIAVPARSREFPAPGTVALGFTLLISTAVAWFSMLRDSTTMRMPGAAVSASMGEATMFTVQWGVMMAAMMLPSAAPMILLYRMVSRRLARQGERGVPATAFAAVYLLLWAATGVPVYAAYILVGAATDLVPGFAGLVPYGVAGLLVAAGGYQFSDAKQVCLRNCESPLQFLMTRWQGGYAATLRLALQHAGFCIGCCWALMLVLVGVGAMSLPWVITIAALVFVEKLVPRRFRAARVVGVALLLLGAAVLIRPTLAVTMRGTEMTMHGGMQQH